MADHPIMTTTAKRKERDEGEPPTEKKKQKTIDFGEKYKHRKKKKKEEEEYIPLKIMNKRMGVDGYEMEYLVQWKDYPNIRDWTWEPDDAHVFQLNRFLIHNYEASRTR